MLPEQRDAIDFYSVVEMLVFGVYDFNQCNPCNLWLEEKDTDRITGWDRKNRIILSCESCYPVKNILCFGF